MEPMHLTDTHSVTFLCDVDIHESIQKEAVENFEGNFSQALRKILKTWNESQDD
jgi:hypothetical protein